MKVHLSDNDPRESFVRFKARDWDGALNILDACEEMLPEGYRVQGVKLVRRSEGKGRGVSVTLILRWREGQPLGLEETAKMLEPLERAWAEA